MGHAEDGPPLMPITPPKHMTIPDIPRISEIGFETMMLVFSLMCLALQYLNIYRTVFWLPHSHTKYAMASKMFPTVINMIVKRSTFQIFE